MRFHSTPAATVLFALVAQIVAQGDDGVELQVCYGTTGTAYGDQKKCPGSATCCSPDWECMPNRLCQPPDYEENRFIRGPCDFRPWNPSRCAAICTYPEYEGDDYWFPRIERCDDGSFCCDNDSGCCAGGRGVFLSDDGDIISGPSSSASSSSSSSSSTSSSSSSSSSTETTSSSSTVTSSSPTDTSSSTETSSSTVTSSTTTETTPEANEATDRGDSSDDTGMKIGLGVGIGGGVLLIAALAAWFFIRRSRKNKQAAAQPAVVEADAGQQAGGWASHGHMHQAPYYQPQEQKPTPHSGWMSQSPGSELASEPVVRHELGDSPTGRYQ